MVEGKGEWGGSKSTGKWKNSEEGHSWQEGLEGGGGICRLADILKEMPVFTHNGEGERELTNRWTDGTAKQMD